MNRVLLIIGGLLVGLLAALFIVPAFVDWTRYRGVFEEEATRLLGRDVRVGGKVNLRLLPSPYIRFEKVRVADTKATVGEPLFRADDFTVWLAIGPLLGGNIEASVIELRKPALTLVLDDKGGGNWTSFSETAAKSYFAPSKVAFSNVRLTNGTIAIFGPGGNERTKFEHINGEFSAPAIEGPYRIAAAFANNGAPRELRLSTAKPEADGAIRFKGTVRAPSSGASYTLDGRVSDLFQQPRLQGELSAKLPIPSTAAASDTTPARAAGASEPSFDLKAMLRADTSGAEFNDIALSFEQDNQPQLATGLARVVWRDKMTATVQLNSKWLDLDRILGRGPTTTLPEMFEQFAAGLETSLPSVGQTLLKIVVDQATLGGDLVSGLALTGERKEGGLGVQFGAAVPGGGRVDAQGTLTLAGRERAFDGEISLRGTSATRFAAWAGRNTALPQIKRDGPFTINGKATLGRERLVGRELTIQFAGNNLAGDASWSTGTNGRQITLALEGTELDVTPLLETESTPVAAIEALLARFVDWPASTPAIQAAAPVKPHAPTNVAARLRVGQLVAGRVTLRDVTTDVRLSAGNLSIPLLSFGSEGGWSAEIRGDIANLSKPGSKGAITWGLTAETPQGLQEMLAFAEIGDAWRPSLRRAATLVPLRMAGRFRLGETATGVHDLSADGNIGPTRAAGTLRLEPRGDSWRDHRTDVALVLDAADFARLIEQIAPEGITPGVGLSLPPNSGPASGKITLRGIGTPKAGLVSLVDVEASVLASEYRGRLSVTETAAISIDGDVRLSTANLGRCLALFGFRERTSIAGHPASGILTVSGNLERLRLASSRIDIGTTTLSGKGEVRIGAGENRFDGNISTNAFSVPALLGLLTIPKAAQPSALPPPAQQTVRPSNWSEDIFDLANLGTVVGNLRIQTDRLGLAPEISLGKAVIETAVKAGRLEIKVVEAAAIDGKLTGSLALERTATGANAKSSIRFNGGQLAAYFPANTKPAAIGAVTLKLDLEGTALSPRSLIAALRGKGELGLAQARLDRLAPKGVREAVDALLAAKGDIPLGDLARRLTMAMASGTTQVGQRTLEVNVGDGAVQFAPMLIETPDGRLTGTSIIDLDALRFDSEWRIDLKPAAPAAVDGKVRAPLPSVTVLYAGQLGQLGAVEPRLNADNLERELAVRKVERDLDELERLRKQDEERARNEAERRKLQEAERAAASPPNVGPAGPQGPQQGTGTSPGGRLGPGTTTPSGGQQPSGAPSSIPPDRQAPAPRDGSRTESTPVRPSPVDVPLFEPVIRVEVPLPISTPTQETSRTELTPAIGANSELVEQPGVTQRSVADPAKAGLVKSAPSKTGPQKSGAKELFRDLNQNHQ